MEGSPDLMASLDELLPPRRAYALRRAFDAVRFGSGMDYEWSEELALVKSDRAKARV